MLCTCLVPPLPPKKADSAKRAQQTKSRDCSDLQLDPNQDLAAQVANDIPTNSTGSISSPSHPEPSHARAPRPFSNSERPKSYHVQEPDPVETSQQEVEYQQQQPLPQARQEEKSKLLVPDPVVINQPSSGMIFMATIKVESH